MGICEHRILDHQHPVMHWEHNDRFPGQTYDSPRDLSPNLPPLCDTITSMNLKIDQNLNQSTILGHIAPPTTPSNFQHVINNNNNNNNITQICTSSCSQSSMNATSSLMPQNTKTAAAISNFDLVKTPKLEPDSSPLQFFQQQQQSLVNDTEICAGCNLKIYDRYYLQAVDRRWHINCLQCFQCRMPLDGETSCYSHDGNIYCKKDYQRMKRCSRCQLEIASTELVMRAREFVFHIRCFSCIICRSPLTKGDHFGLRDGAVFCRLHYDISLSDSMNQDRNCLTSFPSPDFSKHIVPSMTLPNSSESLPHCRTNPSKPITGSDNTSTNFNYFNGSNVTNMDTFTSNSPHSSSTTPRQKGRPRKRKPKDLDSMHNNLDQSNDYVDMGSFGRSPLNDGCDGNMSSMHGSSSRAKRMRTSFKHHQLRTMKSYFAINHNPDAKDLKQLAQKTGLQKRVLQVWFQNARAKWRRMIVKQGAKSPLNSSDKCSGPSSDTSNLSDLDMYAPPGTLSGNNLQAINPHSPQFSLS